MDFWTDLGQDTSDNDLCCWRVLVACPTRTIWSTRPFTNYSGITKFIVNTVDGRNPANQLRLVVFPIIHRVSYIPGAGFQPSTVVWSLVSFSQQYIQKTYRDTLPEKKKFAPKFWFSRKSHLPTIDFQGSKGQAFIQRCSITKKTPAHRINVWLVGGWTTHFKNMLVKSDHFPNFQGEQVNI